MSKNYKNEKLKKYLDKHISKMKINNKFKPYIVDILMRRTYQYELTPEEVRADVDTLRRTLEGIEIVDQSEMGVKWAAGQYDPETRKISISSEIVKNQNSEELYQTLTHEVYHALTHEVLASNYNYDRLAGYNKFTNQYNSSLLETIVEKSSYKTVYGTTSGNPFYNDRSSRGYSDITFVLDAIEAVYGVNEQDLLKHSIHSRDKMIDFLAQSMGESRSETIEFIDKVEMNLSQMHRALYPPDGVQVSPSEKSYNVSNGLCYMKNVCMQKMNERIAKTQDLDRRKLESTAFDLDKLNIIFDERIVYFDDFLYWQGIQSNIKYDMDSNPFLQEETKEATKRMKDLAQVCKNKDKMPPDIQKRLLNWAKNGNLSSYDETINRVARSNGEVPVFLADYGVRPIRDMNRMDKFDVLKDYPMKVSRYRELCNEKNDSYKYTDNWDNRNIQGLKKDCKPKFRERVKNWFNKVKNSFKVSQSSEYFLEEGKTVYMAPNETNIMQNDSQSFDMRYRANEDVQKRVVEVGQNFSIDNKRNGDLQNTKGNDIGFEK